MPPPAGSLRLIKRHIRELRISRTTIIVTIYFIINVLGRLSVAIFGLAYNMMDKTGIEYPILATNWTSVSWTNHVNPTTNAVVHPPIPNFQGAEGKDTSSKALSCSNELTQKKKSCQIPYGMDCGSIPRDQTGLTRTSLKSLSLTLETIAPTYCQALKSQTLH